MIMPERIYDTKSKKFSLVKLIKFLAIPVVFISIGIFLLTQGSDFGKKIRRDQKNNENQNGEQFIKKNEPNEFHADEDPYAETNKQIFTTPNVIHPPTNTPVINQPETTEPNLDKKKLSETSKSLPCQKEEEEEDFTAKEEVVTDPEILTLEKVIETTTVETVKKPHCRIELDVNYPKDDMSELIAETKEDCCAACINMENCKAWAYLTAAKHCFLKNALPDSEKRIEFKGIVYGIIEYS